MSYILVPSTSVPTPAPALHLLPFSLAPLPASAPIAAYFRPRASPPSSGLPAHTSLAAFRGRQVVGHALGVPPGFQGVVLEAPAAWAGTSAAAEPAENRSSAATAAAADAPPGRTRGAGQTARARPRTRRAAAKRTYALGSDDEAPAQAPRLPKRASVARTQTRTPSPAPAAGVPRINVVDATPVKRALADKAASIASIAETLVDEPLALESAPKADGSVDAVSAQLAAASEAIIPSPATENDVPAFAIDAPAAVAAGLAAYAKADADAGAGAAQNTHADIDARVLRPVHTFDSFTLWVPDVPIPGFGTATVGDEQSEEATRVKREDEDGAGETADAADAKRQAGGVELGALRPGWWAAAGAGEGGDEFVRGLGEWLGLVQVINAPVIDDDDDNDDDE
ncbi:hypothetical protein Q5752_002815 [Cryptotrichosporon argae]